MESKIYCGNNRQHPNLLNNTNVIGTRYQCLKKGIGMGKNLPVDANMGGAYQPIVNRKWYCGKANRLPRGYGGFGSNTECLQMGVGIGMAQSTTPKNLFFRYLNFFLFFILIYFITFLVFWYFTPVGYNKWIYALIATIIIIGIMWIFKIRFN